MAEISIIVPVYRVEKYLQRCVESLLSQTFGDIEIILVDDGSPDQCPAMCDQFSEKDSRIRVIHKENGGLSSARNAGIEIAQGKYIGFVDSDDDVADNMYERMHEIIERENVDFVMSDYIRIPDNGEKFLKTLAIPGGRYSRDAIKKAIFPQLIMGENLEYGPLLSVWHCLYNLEFLHKFHINFDEDVRWSEDNIFSALVGYYAHSFYYIKGEGLYYYHQNSGTITTSYRKGAWKVYKIMNHHLCDFFGNKKEFDFTNQLKLHLIYYACNCLGQTALLSKIERKDEIRKVLNDDELSAAFNKVKIGRIGIKLKIQLILMKKKCCWLLERIISMR